MFRLGSLALKAAASQWQSKTAKAKRVLGAGDVSALVSNQSRGPEYAADCQQTGAGLPIELTVAHDVGGAVVIQDAGPSQIAHEIQEGLEEADQVGQHQHADTNADGDGTAIAEGSDAHNESAAGD